MLELCLSFLQERADLDEPFLRLPEESANHRGVVVYGFQIGPLNLNGHWARIDRW